MLNLTSASPATMFASILIFLVVIGFVISLHEAAHAFAANRLGDPTARLLGRMSLNPAAHIDPVGTVLVPLVLLILSIRTGSFFLFGWAKPTPINPFNFQHPRRDTAIVAFAGPASNFSLAILLSLIFRLIPSSLVSSILLTVIVLNLILGIFNLIPIPPLDGSKILAGFLPKEAAASFSALESYGPVLLLVLIFILLPILSPTISTILSFFLRVFAGVTI